MNRKQWEKQNEFSDCYAELELCLNCVNFSVNFDNPMIGECLLIQECMPDNDCTVPATGVCKLYADTQGIGFNKEVVIPALANL